MTLGVFFIFINRMAKGITLKKKKKNVIAMSWMNFTASVCVGLEKRKIIMDVDEQFFFTVELHIGSVHMESRVDNIYVGNEHIQCINIVLLRYGVGRDQVA